MIVIFGRSSINAVTTVTSLEAGGPLFIPSLLFAECKKWHFGHIDKRRHYLIEEGEKVPSLKKVRFIDAVMPFSLEVKAICNVMVLYLTVVSAACILRRESCVATYGNSMRND